MSSEAKDKADRRPTRRSVVRTAVMAPIVDQFASGARRDERQPDLIANENRKTGDTDWQLTNVRLDKTGALPGARHRRLLLASEHRRRATLSTIMVSADPPGRFHVEIFRMGYYGGAGARLMTDSRPVFEGKPQPEPPVGPRRLRECCWEPATELKIPRDWPSGVYLGRLTPHAGKRECPRLAELHRIRRARPPPGRHPLPGQ